MHNVVIDQPYEFVPPHRGEWWPWILQKLLRWRLRREYGLMQIECHGGERLKAAVRAGDGVLIAPNHCRPCDPDVVHEYARQVGLLPFILASWHLFMQNRLQSFLLRRIGAFSIYREGMDRAAITASIDILVASGRPLVVFAEGVITRTNDRLNELQEGTAFIARSAAKKRAKENGSGRVVVYPLAIRYHYDGDVRQAVTPALTEIERRLSWRPQLHLSLEQRVQKLGRALLTLKEVEYLTEPRTGTVGERVQQLIDAILTPLEQEWLNGERESNVVARVKALRATVLPDMVQGELSEAERERRWLQLADMYLAQQLSCYPPDYLADQPTAERWLETVERFEEDLTDRCRRYEPLRAVVTLGEEIVVSPARDRGAASDPLMVEIERQLKHLLRIK
jgi:1-acyl-sn-glycerol-3-phosphate acyltransferase